jgi:hypothetical protein
LWALLLQQNGFASVMQLSLAMICAPRRLRRLLISLSQVAAGFSAGSAIAVLGGGFLFCRVQAAGRRNLTFLLCATTAGASAPPALLHCPICEMAWLQCWAHCLQCKPSAAWLAEQLPF